MKKSNKSMWKNVMQRIPEEAKEIVTVALKNNPTMIRDLDKIVRTHSCRPERAMELTEHVVALVASELPEADRKHLRNVAFNAHAIDESKKTLRCASIAKISKSDGGGFSITESDGWSLWFDDAADGYEPQVGSIIWLYTTNFSYVMGIVVDGHVFRYQTITQRDAEWKAEKERQRAEARARFPEHDAKIAKLPEIFQERIKKFQRAPHFREDLEDYEIFVCEQAVLFVERLKTVEELFKFHDMNYEQQVQLIPELKDAGHSGNTFGFACVLARVYLEKPEAITQMCGALSPLVGSDAYLPLEERVEKSA